MAVKSAPRGDTRIPDIIISVPGKECGLSKVILVRHGRTAWHAEGRYAGITDVPLDELGREQADRVAARLASDSIDVVYSSPLSRCLELAVKVAGLHGLEVVVDERLREIDLGRWDGEPIERIIEMDGDLIKRWTRDPLTEIPGGESLQSVQGRAMEWYREATASAGDGMILASSHGGPIRAILAAVLGLPLSNIFRLTVDLASISVINAMGKLSNLECLNDRAHLDGLDQGTLL